MRFRTTAIAIAVAAALPSVAGAVDFSYSAFSSAGYVQTDEDLAQYGYVGMPEGVDSEGSYEYDSKFGLQVTAKLNEMFSATAQGVAYTDLTSNWEPRLDWAYLQFKPVQSLSAKVGYMRAPTFMFSDSVFIGYANTWVRPPIEVYNLAPAYQLRGIQLSWRQQIGPVNFSLQPYFGDSELKMGATEQPFKMKNWMGVAAGIQYKAVTLRGGFGSLEMDTISDRLPPLVDGLRAVPAALCGICAIEADRVDMKGDKFTLGEVGVEYDDGGNVFLAEYASRQSEQSYTLPDMHSAYATVGHRFGGLMPYATYAIARREGVTSSNVPAVGPLAPLAVGLGDLLANNNSQDSWSVGIRYEVPGFSVIDGAQLKLQYDSIEAKEGNGMFLNVQPGFDGTANMYSISLDFIF